jgi:hypothetical protein
MTRNAKTIFRMMPLAAVAVVLGVWAAKEFGPTKVSDTGGNTAEQGTTTSAGRMHLDGVTVINFHGTLRCRTCLRIGELAKKTLDEDYAVAVKAGKVHWETVDYQEPANAHFVKDYELRGPTILISRWKNGKEVKWNRLDGIWDLVEDEPTFRAYVADVVRQLLEYPCEMVPASRNDVPRPSPLPPARVPDDARGGGDAPRSARPTAFHGAFVEGFHPIAACDQPE